MDKRGRIEFVLFFTHFEEEFTKYMDVKMIKRIYENGKVEAVDLNDYGLREE